MTIKTSTGLRNAMMATGSFRTVMNECVMNIYAGSIPATSDASLGGATLLCTVTNDATATGLTFEATATDGALTKTVAEVWRGVNVASGAATFYRLETAADDGLASTTQSRVQGVIGVAGADLNLSSTSLISAASQTIDFYAIALPSA